LPETEWKRFGIGFAPTSRSALKDYLITKGAQPAALVDTGLLITPEGGGAPYDRFRNRIIFPIADGRGRVVSFGGRALDPEARAKYLNGPDTAVFHKGNVLYGLPEARKLLHTGGDGAALVVVEGYMDVIACQRAGIAAVAPMGTALTEEQMDALWRLHQEPTLCFDGDAAGRRAANRVVDRALPLLKPTRSFVFVSISGGKDPDEVLRRDGAHALVEQLKKTTPFVQQLFEREKNLDRLDTPERRAGLKIRLRQASSLIQDRDLQFQYKEDLLDRFAAAFPRATFIPGWGRKVRFDGLITKDAAEILKRRLRLFNASLAAAVIREPRLLLPYVEEFSVFGFGEERLDVLKQPLLKALYDGEPTPRLLMSLFEEAAEAKDTAASVFRIAFELKPPLPFLSDAVTDVEARRMWQRAMEVTIEIHAIKAELDGASPGLDRHSVVLPRRSLRDRMLRLEKEVSDLTIWEDA
jgi:DNA primase